MRWLEKNGYDVAYQSGVDTARYGVGDHRVFISCGHDEYWSGQQRANVEWARDSGVNLCFWSGVRIPDVVGNEWIEAMRDGPGPPV